MQISSHLTKIVNLISSHPTVSIVAPTGSGKSVAVPAAIAATGAKCFVTVPTRTAALSLAEYQRILQRAATPGIDADSLIGYAAEGHVNYGSKTMIAYVTGGHARRKLLSYFSKGVAYPIDFCDVLMVDEVHSGSLDTTIIISLWMRAAAAQVRVPRLVIASATPVPITIEPSPEVYTVDLAAFPIIYEYLAKDLDMDDISGVLYIEAARMAAQIHRTTPIESGHILIFAPGSAEVEAVESALAEQLKTPMEGKVADIIPAFGALKPEDIALIYKQTNANERKIVIATNIAEMSITIADVGYVIDTMVEKRAETALSGGFRLSTHFISKDSAKQRAGRTGRTRPGICYRLCTETHYNSLEEHRPPEIQRVPIYETVMELLDVGLSPEVIIKDIDANRIITAIQLLTRLGMVTSDPNGIIVTDMGHFAPKFHISVRNAAFLWHWLHYRGLRFNNKLIKAGHDIAGIDLSYMEVDETSEYQSINPYQMPLVEQIYATENIHPKSIIDATAHVGGDSLNFLLLFPEAILTAIEINPKTAAILRRNVENFSRILGTERNYEATVVNMSAVEYFKVPRYSDLIYFDPPWGGREYKLEEKIVLTLDNEGIGVVINRVLAAGMTPLVVLKAPYNVDIDAIVRDLQTQVEIKAYDVMNEVTKRVSYRLYFIRSQGVPLLNASVMQTNIPPLVPLTAVGYPAFPGIVVAALIDCYGPSYFWIPRRKSDVAPEEYNLAIKDYKAQHFAHFVGYNDLETSLNMWANLMNTIGNLKAPPATVVKWARDNSMNNKKIRELLMIVEQSVNTANREGYPVQIGPFTTAGVISAARPLLLSVYSDMTLIHSRDITYFNPVTREDYRLDNRDAINELTAIPPKGIIALITAEIKAPRGVFRIIGFGVDTDKDGLGRPIVEKKQVPRGQRVIARGRQTPKLEPVQNEAEINTALALLGTLNIGAET